jgi:uncharacterized protein (TIGR00725 family)
MTKRSVTVFGSSRVPPGDPLYEVAGRLGRALAVRGAEVRCGGYAGVMEGLALGVREAGGRVVGCTLDWFADSRTPNSALDEVRNSSDLASRVRCLLEGSSAAIALSGGVGTLNEVFWLWTLLMHGRGEGRALILLGEPWGELMKVLSARFELDEPVRRLARVASSVDEAADLACGTESRR